MKTTSMNAQIKEDADKLAEFVLMTQRSCILNLSDQLNNDNLSFPQFFLLTYLASEESLTMSDIAKKMGHSTAAATGLVDRLQKLGFVKRTHATEDRRKILVKISKAGTKLVSQMRQSISKNLSQMMLETDSEEAQVLNNAKSTLRA